MVVTSVYLFTTKYTHTHVHIYDYIYVCIDIVQLVINELRPNHLDSWLQLRGYILLYGSSDERIYYTDKLKFFCCIVNT